MKRTGEIDCRSHSGNNRAFIFESKFLKYSLRTCSSMGRTRLKTKAWTAEHYSQKMPAFDQGRFWEKTQWGRSRKWEASDLKHEITKGLVDLKLMKALAHSLSRLPATPAMAACLQNTQTEHRNRSALFISAEVAREMY